MSDCCEKRVREERKRILTALSGLFKCPHDDCILTLGEVRKIVSCESSGGEK